MPINGSVKVLNPEKAVLEITIRAPMDEWASIAKTLGEDQRWPQWKFAATISDAIRKTVDRVESFHEIND